MSKIVVIGAGAMGTAFAFPCLDNNHDINIIGTHLEDNFIDQTKVNMRLHPGLNINIPEGINLFKFQNFESILNSLICLQKLHGKIFPSRLSNIAPPPRCFIIKQIHL